MATPKLFPHPLGVLLFNRPEYARRVLESIANQTLPVDPSKLYISIDGYSGSKVEHQRKSDHTGAIEAMAREFFPTAHIRRFESNIGFTEVNWYLEERMRTDHPRATWIGFFEEDYVLAPDYLAIVTALAAKADADNISLTMQLPESLAAQDGNEG